MNFTNKHWKFKHSAQTVSWKWKCYAGTKFIQMSQKQCNLKFKGSNYFVIVIEKFQFAKSSGNTQLMSLKEVSGLTQFFHTSYSSVKCLCTKYHAAFSSVHCWTLFLNAVQSYEAVEWAYQVHFVDAAVPGMSTTFIPVNKWCHFLQFLSIYQNTFQAKTQLYQLIWRKTWINVNDFLEMCH
jgi:hypothetical protein